MPTGYTHAIVDGQSFNDFVLGCARAFGACIDLRDSDLSEPIPDKFKESPYHKDAYGKAVSKLEEFNRMDAEAVERLMESEYQEEVAQREKSIKKANDQIERYEAMLEKVKQWVPPTEDHQGLKNFMIEQIESSIKFDDMRDYYKKHPVIKLSVEQWKYENIIKLKRDIEYHMKEWKEETKRTFGRNEWIDQLRKSLKVT